MIDFIKRLLNLEDEFVGIWGTSNDGGWGMLSGSQLIIKSNGKGTMTSWGHGAEEPFNFESDIEWFRKSKNQIAIKNSEDEKFAIVDYILETYTSGYNQKFYLLYDPNYSLLKTRNINGFWEIPGELYRKRYF